MKKLWDWINWLADKKDDQFYPALIGICGFLGNLIPMSIAMIFTSNWFIITTVLAADWALKAFALRYLVYWDHYSDDLQWKKIESELNEFEEEPDEE